MLPVEVQRLGVEINAHDMRSKEFWWLGWTSRLCFERKFRAVDDVLEHGLDRGDWNTIHETVKGFLLNDGWMVKVLDELAEGVMRILEKSLDFVRSIAAIHDFVIP